jgi:hypothetical protein
MAAIGEGSQTCDEDQIDAQGRGNAVIDLLEEFHAGQTPDEVELVLPEACISGVSSDAEGRPCAAAEQRGGAEGADLVLGKGPVQGSVGEASAGLCA